MLVRDVVKVNRIEMLEAEWRHHGEQNDVIKANGMEMLEAEWN